MRSRLIMIISVLAVALVACGGSSVTPHFFATADAICANANRQIEALAPPTKAPGSIAAVLRRGFAYARAEYQRLSSLTAPSGRERLFVTGLQASAHLLHLGGGEIAAFARGDVKAADKLLGAGDRYSGEADASMSLLGLGACAANPQPTGKG
jgi:hypothetical protein